MKNDKEKSLARFLGKKEDEDGDRALVIITSYKIIIKKEAMDILNPDEKEAFELLLLKLLKGVRK